MIMDVRDGFADLLRHGWIAGIVAGPDHSHDAHGGAVRANEWQLGGQVPTFGATVAMEQLKPVHHRLARLHHTQIVHAHRVGQVRWEEGEIRGGQQVFLSLYAQVLEKTAARSHEPASAVFHEVACV